MTRKISEWTGVELGPDANLLLGRKRGANLQVRSLAMSDKLASDFRSIAEQSLQEAARRVAKPWTDVADLAEDEAFQIDASDLPEREQPKRASEAYRDSFAPLEMSDVPNAAARASSLGLLLAHPGSLDPISVSESTSFSFSFYAVTFSNTENSPVSFVKHHRPLQLMRGDRSLFGTLSDDVVDEAKGQIVSFTRDFDLILDGTEILALRDVVSELFADLNLVAAAVPVMLDQLADLSKLKITVGAIDALRTAISGRRLLARRLLSLVNDPATADVTPQRVRAYLKVINVDPASFIQNGKITCTVDTAPALLDYLKGSRGRHPFTGDLVRNDKQSKVT